MGDVMKVVIIDDDINFANKLKNYLIKFNTISWTTRQKWYPTNFSPVVIPLIANRAYN